MSQTARLGMQYLQTAQLAKETTINEGFAALDLAVCAAIDGFLVNAPPVSPTVGSCYVVGAAPSGTWAGHPFALAGYTVGGWRMIEPIEGLTALDKASGRLACFVSGAWEKGNVRAAKLTVGANQVVGARLAGVADPTGGTTVDPEARAAIAAMLARLRQHGLIDS